MPDVTVASTTDTQDQVNQAAGAVQTEEIEERPVPTGDLQIDSGTEEEAPEPEKPAEKEPPKPSNADKRIDKLTREKKEALEREARALAELEAFKKSQHPPLPNPQATPLPNELPQYEEWSAKQLEEGKPGDIKDYTLFVISWNDEQKAQKEAAKAADRAIKKIDTDHYERVEAFKQEQPDFDEVVSSANFYVSTDVGKLLKLHPLGPNVIYYLASNPEHGKSLSKMSEHEALAEVGSIAQMLRSKQEPPMAPTNGSNGKSPDRKPVVSGAPPPIKPLGGHGINTSKANYDNMSQADYNRLRDKEEKARRGY